jgi:hypothetical protein
MLSSQDGGVLLFDCTAGRRFDQSGILNNVWVMGLLHLLPHQKTKRSADVRIRKALKYPGSAPP